MSAIRRYDPTSDYERVTRFLIDTYRAGPAFGNWLQPRWEYMHHHPFIDNVELTRIGIVEENGHILGVVHPESRMDEVYVQTSSDDDEVTTALVEHALETFGGWSDRLGKNLLGLYVSEHSETLQRLVSDRGFVRSGDGEPQSRRLLTEPVRIPALPEGFELASLDDELDLSLVNRVLWRGFNHDGPPPDEEIPGRARIKTAPNFRHDLTIVVKAPDGTYASYCGVWFVAENRVAYVEPVATDPSYRRRGLGAAVVLEALRRVRRLGADVAWVGSDQAFYSAIGFDVMFTFELWVRELGT